MVHLPGAPGGVGRGAHLPEGVAKPRGTPQSLELELKAISDYMTRDRYEAILAQLSFMLVGETRFEGDKLAKLRELVSLLLSRCAQAWDIEQHFTIDDQSLASRAAAGTAPSFGQCMSRLSHVPLVPT